jgi:hypothetical protein
MRIDEIMRAGKGRNAAVQQAYEEAYREDRPDLVGDDCNVYLIPKADPYCKSQKQMRKMGKRDFLLPVGQDFAVAATETFLKEVVDFLQEEGVLDENKASTLEVLRRRFRVRQSARC